MKEKEIIDIFNNSSKIINNPNKNSIISWNTIIILLIIFCLIFINIPFNRYKILQGTISNINNEFYITIDKTENSFPIINTDKLYIEYNEYNYQVIEINDNYIILKISSLNKYNIDNNIVLVKFKSERTTISKKLKELIRERVKK